MKIKSTVPVSIKIGEKRVVIRPHNKVSLPDSLAKTIIEKADGKVKKVRG